MLSKSWRRDMDLESVVGMRSPARKITVEAGRLVDFARTTDARNPIYWDEAEAIKAGYSSIPAPPSFLFSLGMLAPEETHVLEQMGVDESRILHGGEKFVYGAPICAGDTIELETVVAEAYEKKGGALTFVVTETQATNQDGVFAGKSVTTFVIR